MGSVDKKKVINHTSNHNRAQFVFEIVIMWPAFEFVVLWLYKNMNVLIVQRQL